MCLSIVFYSFRFVQGSIGGKHIFDLFNPYAYS